MAPTFYSTQPQQQVEAPTNPNRLVSQADVEHCPFVTDFLRRQVEGEGDEVSKTSDRKTPCLNSRSCVGGVDRKTPRSINAPKTRVTGRL